MDDYADRLHVENMRGELRDILTLEPYFGRLTPGRFKLVILDAFYRFLPKETDENDNGSIATLYNMIDRYADRLGCAFVLIHHTSKGVQAGKSVTDVGAGAGSQSRAADAHLILRQHEQDGACVLDAAVRSWEPVTPLCLRWNVPVWNPATELDPNDLRKETRRQRKEEKTPIEAKPEWTVESFVAEFVTPDPQTQQRIIDRASTGRGLSERQAAKLLRLAADDGIIHKWTPANPKTPVKFATQEQPVTATGDDQTLTVESCAKPRRKGKK